MQYQNTFQQLEQPSQTFLSCHTYYGKANDVFPRHCHSYYEISYIMEGRRFETLNNDRYEVNDNTLIFIPPLTIHNLQNISPVNDIVIQFSHKYLRNSSVLFDSRYVIKPPGKHIGIYKPDPSDDICRILKSIFDLCEVRKISTEKNQLSLIDNVRIDFSLNSLCLQLISCMLKEGLLRIEESSASYSDIENFDLLFREILANISNPINMQAACQIVGLSYSHFSRTFEKITGYHYTYFCNLLRIRYAEELLLSTSLSISEVAEAIGINTISYFTRLFKQINGITPSQYRRKYQAK